MIHPEVTDLYHNYQKHTHTELTKEQFITLLTFFPSVQVLTADGKVDEEEQFYLDHIARAMANTFREELNNNFALLDLEANYKKEIAFLIANLPYWEAKFVYGLKLYLQTMPELKKVVIEVMYMFADASEQVSENEQELISNLKAELGIID